MWSLDWQSSLPERSSTVPQGSQTGRLVHPDKRRVIPGWWFGTWMDYDFPILIGNGKSSQFSPSLTTIDHRGWNHQPDPYSSIFGESFTPESSQPERIGKHHHLTGPLTTLTQCAFGGTTVMSGGQRTSKKPHVTWEGREPGLYSNPLVSGGHLSPSISSISWNLDFLFDG